MKVRLLHHMIIDNSNYPSQTNINENNPNNANIEDKPINLSPNIPSPHSIEEEQIPQDTNLEVKEPAYQLQVIPQQINNNNKNNRSSCEDCCNDCCDDCCSCLQRLLL